MDGLGEILAEIFCARVIDGGNAVGIRLLLEAEPLGQGDGGQRRGAALERREHGATAAVEGLSFGDAVRLVMAEHRPAVAFLREGIFGEPPLV